MPQAGYSQDRAMPRKATRIFYVCRPDNNGVKRSWKLKFILETIKNLVDIVHCLALSDHRVNSNWHIFWLVARHSVLPPVQQQHLRQQEHHPVWGVPAGFLKSCFQHHSVNNSLFWVLLQLWGQTWLYPHISPPSHYLLLVGVSDPNWPVRSDHPEK